MQKALRWTLASILIASAAPVGAEAPSAQVAFDQLKTLVGTWQGEWKGEGEAAEAEAAAEAPLAVHEFRVAAAGTVLMEVMGPGTDHEMINMYHVDGDQLLLTHYCAGGNQPRMRLDRDQSTAGKLVFEFFDGTNLNAAKDPHIHGAELRFAEDGSLVSRWTSYMEGEPNGVMTFHLARK